MNGIGLVVCQIPSISVAKKITKGRALSSSIVLRGALSSGIVLCCFHNIRVRPVSLVSTEKEILFYTDKGDWHV